MERALSARQIQIHFPDVSDQAVPSGVVGRVLGKQTFGVLVHEAEIADALTRRRVLLANSVAQDGDHDRQRRKALLTVDYDVRRDTFGGARLGLRDNRAQKMTAGWIKSVCLDDVVP